ncbi:MAG: Gfo/Idh/MocA family oxidoreductase [Candidatus Firestonebacteria bacterium]
MQNGKLGFAIVGAGVIGPAHAKAILANKENAEFIAVCDIAEEKAKKLAADYGAKEVYKNYKEMLENRKIDVVHICNPSGLHGEIIKAAAEAGKHIIVEKPLEVTEKKCDDAIKVCRGNKVKLGVIFQRRTFPTSKFLKKTIEEGKFGKLVLGDAYLKYSRSAEYYKSAGWRATMEFDGGGVLMNQGIHGIDLINWMMGGVSSVYALCETKTRNIQVEDTALVMVKYKNGAIGIIEGTTSIYPELPTRFEISGEKGTVIMSDAGYLTWDFAGEKEKPSVNNDIKDISMIGHGYQVRDMIEAIKEDREPMINGEEGKKAVKLIMSIYQSSKEKREIRI